MKKALQSNGNSWHLYISKPAVQLLGIADDERTVILKIENKVLFVNKISNKEAQKYKNYLCKNLVKKNSSYSLNFTKSLLELLDINPETDMIDYEINGETLIIKKAP